MVAYSTRRTQVLFVDSDSLLGRVLEMIVNYSDTAKQEADQEEAIPTNGKTHAPRSAAKTNGTNGRNGGQETSRPRGESSDAAILVLGRTDASPDMRELMEAVADVRRPKNGFDHSHTNRSGNGNGTVNGSWPAAVQVESSEGTDLLEDNDLSPREREILQALAQGASNRDISESSFISENTVKTHIRHILAKLKVNNRTQAAVLTAGGSISEHAG